MYLTDRLRLSPFNPFELPQHPLLDESGIKLNAPDPDQPIFKPPTGRREGPGSDFLCDYSNMGPDWYSCSSPENRGCWLRNRFDGSEYNILTDYENDAPTGITRNYTLYVNDGKLDSDGLPFNDAKLFNNSYPGPWIQACWGDVSSA